MRKSGRVGIITIMVLAIAVGVIFIGLLVFSSKDSPVGAATNFMNALATGNVNKLTKLSYMPGESEEQIQKEWEFTTQVAGKYYVFTWSPIQTVYSGKTSAAVQIQFTASANKSGAYPQNGSIPMIYDQGAWKVEVRGLERDFYPALPR